MGKKKRTCIECQDYSAEYGAYYKETLQKLLEHRDLESALYLRIAMETGIRSRDILLMDDSCVKGRYVRMFSGKDRKRYSRLNGEPPKISRCTKRMIAALIRTQGRIFTKPYEYYLIKIKKTWPEAGFSLHMLRQVWWRRDVMITGLERKVMITGLERKLVKDWSINGIYT